MLPSASAPNPPPGIRPLVGPDTTSHQDKPEERKGGTSSRVAIDNARLSIANGQLDVTETWIKLGEYCDRKISECREQLEDLEVALNRMEERDLA